MKKYALLMVAAAMTFTMAACGQGSSSGGSAKASSAADTTVAAETSAATETSAASGSAAAAGASSAESSSVTETSAATEAAAGKENSAAAETSAASESSAAGNASAQSALAETGNKNAGNGAAEGSHKKVESDAAAAETDDEAALKPLEYEYTDYIRDYPGLDDEDVKFTANTQLIRITSPGYEALQASLDELNARWKETVDYSFAEQAHEFASGEINEYLQQLLPFSNQQWINMTRADSKVLSFAITSDQWYGGAHPYAYQLGFHYDSATGKALELKDMVKDYDAFYDAVHTLLENHENHDGFFDGWEDTLHETFYGDSEVQPNWTLDHKGLNLWFNQYEIAPYAAGPVFLDLPAEEYKDLLKEEYFEGEIREINETNGNFDTNKLQVYECVRKTGRYESSSGDYTFNYSYILPELYGPETDYVREINKEIAELRSSRVDPQIEAIEKGEEPSLFHAGYSAVTWQGITSIVLSLDTPSDQRIWRVWNLHEDGTKADNAEVLELFDMTPESFVEAAREQLAERVDWALSYAGGGDETGDADGTENADGSYSMEAELKKMREDTLAEENCNSSMPVCITRSRGLAFVGGFYTPAGSGYVEQLFRVPGTEHRPDGLTQLDINPMSQDNYILKDKSCDIQDNGSGETYHFDADTVIVEGVPCYDDGCDAMTWLDRYLEHPAFAEAASDDPYAMSGFAQGDILTVLVDEDKNIRVLQSIGYWD